MVNARVLEHFRIRASLSIDAQTDLRGFLYGQGFEIRARLQFRAICRFLREGAAGHILVRLDREPGPGDDTSTVKMALRGIRA